MTAHDRHRDHEALRDDLAAYALGALPEEEARTLEEHVEGCARCRELLDWLSPAVNVLPAAVPQLRPPDSLRVRVMARVRAEDDASASPGADPAATRSDVRRGSWWQRLVGGAVRPATALAMAAILAIGIGAGYVLRGDRDGGVESTFVRAQPLGGKPSVSATLERHGDSATLHVNHIPEPPRGKVYEVWVERAGVIEPSSLFVPSADGSAAAAIPGPLTGADRVLITAEPEGGSRKPTSPPLLEATLR